KGESIQPGRSLRREVKNELVTIVDEPITVDWFVMADCQIAREPGRGACRISIDRDRLDPVDDVLHAQMRPRRLRHVKSGPRIAWLGADVQKERAIRAQHP